MVIIEPPKASPNKINYVESLGPSSKKTVKKRLTWPAVQLILILILVLLGGFGLLRTMVIGNLIDINEAEAEEAARPANLELIVVTDKRCDDCGSMAGYISFIKGKNVNFTSEQNFDILDEQAWKIVDQFGIKKVPFFVVTGEINKIDELKQVWSGWGQVDGDTFVLTDPLPPFLNMETEQVEGRVDVTYITDKSCSECYDVTLHKKILENNYRISLNEESTVDISDEEGRKFVDEYNITQIPTFFVNNQAAVYPGFLAAWNQVGTIESDGTYVFRKTELMGSYYDLDKNEVVEPASAAKAE